MKLDPIIERACTWSLNTIIWSYHSAVIVQTKIKEEGRKFEKKELKKNVILFSLITLITGFIATFLFIF